MSREELLGRVAYSRAGRDQNRAFMIVAVVNESYVLLVDGELRKAEAPKMKSLKHLSLTRHYLPEMTEMLNEGKYPQNCEIRKALKRILKDCDNIGKGV